jgi:hypothetical protein
VSWRAPTLIHQDLTDSFLVNLLKSFKLANRLCFLMASNDFVLDWWKTGPPPRKGQRQRLPTRFWYNFWKTYPELIEYARGDTVIPAEDVKFLHMFSGSITWGDTTDIRPESGAKIVAPYDDLPIEDNIYDVVIADPPYNVGFANRWTTHDKDLPKPKYILVEAARVTKSGGLIFILHIMKIRAWREANVKWLGGHGILCGDNNAVRFLNKFRVLLK